MTILPKQIDFTSRQKLGRHRGEMEIPLLVRGVYPKVPEDTSARRLERVGRVRNTIGCCRLMNPWGWWTIVVPQSIGILRRVYPGRRKL